MEGHFDNTDMLDCYTAERLGGDQKTRQNFAIGTIKSAICNDQKFPQ